MYTITIRNRVNHFMKPIELIAESKLSMKWKWFKVYLTAFVLYQHLGTVVFDVEEETGIWWFTVHPNDTESIDLFSVDVVYTPASMDGYLQT